MGLKLSTKLRTALLSGDEFRSIFDDAVIQIWGGTLNAPLTADAAATGTLLVTIGNPGGDVALGEVSTAKEAIWTITSHGSAETFKVTLNGTTYTYTNTPDLSAAGVAAGCAEMINRSGEPVWAATGGTAVIYIRSKVRGLSFTINVTTGTPTGTSTLSDDAIANVTQQTIRFGAATDGVIAKDSATWTGTVITEGGQAKYFRLVTSSDTNVDDTSNKVFPRLQGTVGTNSADMILTNTTLAGNSTQTIDAASITLPSS
jgi:hypothetical protein